MVACRSWLIVRAVISTGCSWVSQVILGCPQPVSKQDKQMPFGKITPNTIFWSHCSHSSGLDYYKSFRQLLLTFPLLCFGCWLPPYHNNNAPVTTTACNYTIVILLSVHWTIAQCRLLKFIPSLHHETVAIALCYFFVLLAYCTAVDSLLSLNHFIILLILLLATWPQLLQLQWHCIMTHCSVLCCLLAVTAGWLLP